MEREVFLTQMIEKLKVEYKQKFDEYYALIIEYNEKYNLTAILEEKEVFYKHFLDSVAGADLFKKDARVAEIGSGAGFPSIPLKIVRPDLSFDLFESVGKKCEFFSRKIFDKNGEEYFLTLCTKDKFEDFEYIDFKKLIKW